MFIQQRDVVSAVIADDEPMMRANLREQLAMLWPELQVVAEAEDGPSALASIQAARPSVAFLDIQMPGMTGLEVAPFVPSETRIVFVTAFNQHALDAFEVHAVDYLVKPLQFARLAKLVTRLKDIQRTATPAANVEVGEVLESLCVQPARMSDASNAIDWLSVDTGKQVRMLHIDDVVYFESDNKYTRVVGEDCDGLIRMSLRDLANALGDKPFVQVHRSAIVNRRFVRGVTRVDSGMELELKGRPERLKVSAVHQTLFKPL
jgi:DNA-binding LytR/AlgR family response regulator